MKESDYFLTELKVLIPKLDYDILLKLKSQENISKEDLALVGDILITSWRSYC